MRRRIAIAGVLALAAAVAADVAVGTWLVENGKYGDLPLPPFGLFDRPREREVLELALRRIEEDPELREVELPPEGWINDPNGAEINSIGARADREFTQTPADGTVRVCCYGDSFTFGSEVELGEDWPAQLDALEDDFEVVNLGVRGYGTDQALIRYRRTGDSLHPHVVVVGVLLENIARNVNRFRSLLYPDTPPVVIKPRFVVEDGGLVLVPIPFATRYEAYLAALDGTLRERMREHEYWAGDDPVLPFSSMEGILRAKSARERRRVRGLWLDTEGEPYLVTLAILQAFHDEARAGGAEHVVVVLYPEKRDLADALGETPCYAALLEDLEARGIDYVDAARALERMKKRDIYGKQHLTPRANRLVAIAVRDRLRAHYPAK